MKKLVAVVAVAFIVLCGQARAQTPNNEYFTAFSSISAPAAYIPPVTIAAYDHIKWEAYIAGMSPAGVPGWQINNDSDTASTSYNSIVNDSAFTPSTINGQNQIRIARTSSTLNHYATGHFLNIATSSKTMVGQGIAWGVTQTNQILSGLWNNQTDQATTFQIFSGNPSTTMGAGSYFRLTAWNNSNQ